MKLGVRNLGSGGAPGNIQWTIGLNDVVQDYVVPSPGPTPGYGIGPGSVQKLPASALNAADVSYYWYFPQAAASVSVTVSVGGRMVSANSVFKVLGPTGVSMTSTTPGAVNASGTSTRFLLADGKPSVFGGPNGINFTFSATAPAGGKGRSRRSNSLTRVRHFCTVG